MEDDETGEFELAEINPRMWQSMAPAVRAGQDFPYYYWLMAAGETDRIDPDYELGVGSHLLAGEAQHLKSILDEDSPRVEKPDFAAAVAAVALSCLVEPRFDIFRFDDPAPFALAAFAGVRNRPHRSERDHSPSANRSDPELLDSLRPDGPQTLFAPSSSVSGIPRRRPDRWRRTRHE